MCRLLHRECNDSVQGQDRAAAIVSYRVSNVADGTAYMQGLMHWTERGGETAEMIPGGNRVTVYRR